MILKHESLCCTEMFLNILTLWVRVDFIVLMIDFVIIKFNKGIIKVLLRSIERNYLFLYNNEKLF
jgi:hypothetical protein